MGYQAKIVTGGKIVLPATLRHELGINDGDTVIVERDGDSLRVTTRETVLREVRAALKSTAKGVLSVDDFLAWRRDDNGDV